jgi:hypothetical protein
LCEKCTIKSSTKKYFVAHGGLLIFEKNVYRKPKSAQGCSRNKHQKKKIGTKWPISSAQQHSFTVEVKMHLVKLNVTALKHLPYSSDLSPPNFFLLLGLTSVPDGRFVSTKEWLPKALGTLPKGTILMKM